LNRLVFFLILIVSVTSFVACGKKTSPVSKDSFSLPVPSEKLVKLTDSGINIVNSSEKYFLFVEKSSYDNSGCLDEFKFLTRLGYKKDFLDDNVTTAAKYVYRLTYYDEKLDIFSKRNNVVVTYSKPLTVKDFQYNINEDGSADIYLSFPDSLMYYAFFINNKKIYEGKKENINVVLEKNKINNIKIESYDIYGNKGKEFTAVIDMTEPLILSKPANVRTLKGSGFILISWDAVDGAEKYFVLKQSDKGFEKLGESVNNYFRYKDIPEQCEQFAVKAFSEHGESDMSLFEICP
jgi:hypothetical protein